MKLENNFTIDAPVEKAWEALNSPETVAPCFPGATLTDYEGDSFAGTVKVKLGPIAMTYKGKGTYVSRDEAAHEVVIDANGRDSRGNGTAKATVTASLEADGPDRTAVAMVTDMTITGKPAQFGRGVIADVADRIIGQFAACVARKLAPDAAAPAAADAPAAEEAPAAAGTSAAEAPEATTGAAATGAAATNGVPAPAAAATAVSPEAASTPAASAGTSEAETPAATIPSREPVVAAAASATPAAATTPSAVPGTLEAEASASTETATTGTSAKPPTAEPAAVPGTSEADAPASTVPVSTGTAAEVPTPEADTEPGTSEAEAPASTVPTPEPPTRGSATAPSTPASAAALRAATAPRAPVHSEVDAIDLLDTAGAPVLKRLAPVAGGALLLALVVLLVRRMRAA